MLEKLENNEAIIIETSEYNRTLYCSIEDLRNDGIDKVFSLFRLNKFVYRYIKQGSNGAKRFYKRDDIKRLLEYRNKLTPIRELCSIYGLCYQAMYDWVRLNKFRYIIHLDHPYAELAFVYTEDLEAIKAQKEENSVEGKKIRIFDNKEYVTIKEACKIVGFKIPKSRRKDFNSYTIVGKSAYVSREEAEQFKPYTRIKEIVLEGKK